MNTIKYGKRMFASTSGRRSVVIVGAKRTPVGSIMGSLSNLTAPHLGMVAARGALASCHVEANDIDEVYMG